ncbi:MAG: single-stranded DNA-binding protein [Butyricicoccaceae bacterium]
MANISVVGRIVSDDIELKISANKRPYLRFDLAERTGKGPYARTQYYQVVAFGAIASQFAKKGLHRGALVSVEGVLELEDYLKQDGWTRDKRLKVIAFRWRYLQPGEVEAPVSEQIPEIDGEREPLPG